MCALGVIINEKNALSTYVIESWAGPLTYSNSFTWIISINNLNIKPKFAFNQLGQPLKGSLDELINISILVPFFLLSIYFISYQKYRSINF